MRLKSLTYEDERTGWRLEDLRLDGFNLLVGASGVGKTKILRAIRAVQQVARGGEVPLRGVRFSVHFEHEGKAYLWQLQSTAARAGDEESGLVQAAPSGAAHLILEEQLTEAQAGLILKRQGESFHFKGQQLPPLKRSKSALNLLDDQDIKTIRRAFTSYMINDRASVASISIPEGPFATKGWRSIRSLELLRNQPNMPAVLKALILQEQFPTIFANIKQYFIDIFSSVEDVAVERTTQTYEYDAEEEEDEEMVVESQDHVRLKLKEHGVPGWIDAGDLSSGMLRTFAHLVDLTLAPEGSVVLIDEFENSLGVNCMGPLTDFILSRARELQLILTSHHPYIINNIPKEYWKLVRRKGSTVQVIPSSEIRALQGPSAHDNFIRLINSPEFEVSIG